MAVTVDQADLGHADVAASSTTLALTTAATVASAGMIFFAVSGDSANVSSASGGGLTWTVEVSTTNGLTVSLVRGYAPSGLASGTVVTFTWGSAVTNRVATGSSFLGLANFAAQGSGSATGTAAAWTSSTEDPTSSGGLVLSAIALWTSSGTGNNTPTSPTLQSVEYDAGAGTSDKRVALDYRIQAGGGGVTNAGTWPVTGTQWATADGAFVAAAVAAVVLPPVRANLIYLRKDI